MLQNALIACFQDTMKLANSEPLADATKNACASNRVYEANFVSRARMCEDCVEITVEGDTTFAAAKKYISFGKTAVLNFANPVNPGGGVQNGAAAQEECLCRSSNLYPCLCCDNVFPGFYQYHRMLQDTYYSDRLIYTKNVTVFKDDRDVPLIMPEKDWFQVDVITCAAPYMGRQKYINQRVLHSVFKSRIKNIFEAAADNGVQVLILGAFGCGAFKNPANVVAQAFYEVIQENAYFKTFKRIVFAIKGDSRRGNQNLFAFRKAFKKTGLTVNAPDYCLPKIDLPNGKSIPEVTVSGCKESAMTTIDDVKRNIANGGGYFIDDSFEKEKRETIYKKQRAFLQWQYHNPYFGKQFSVLGDSVSTLAGYNPKDYSVFYKDNVCDKANVRDMDDTWWGKVLAFFHGELLVNNSWSGSRVTQLPDSNTLFPSGCSEERTGGLHIKNVFPDVILVYLGMNDWANGVPLGNEITENSAEAENLCEFAPAYRRMIKNLQSHYPKAEIWCCTLCTTVISSNPSFEFPYAYGGTHIAQYNEIIKKTAVQNNCKIIDLYDFGQPCDTVDGSHPNAGGMQTLATAISRSLGGTDVELFLDCQNGCQNFSSLEQDADSKRICAHCGKSVDKNNNFCPYCGKALSPNTELDICPHCHQRALKHTASSDYCIHCNFEARKFVSPFIWDPVCMNTENISCFSVSFGSLPVTNIAYDGEKLTVCNRINPTDGGQSFPDGFFDERTVPLTQKQITEINRYIQTIDFTKWKTEENIQTNYQKGAAGFFVSESFFCRFQNGHEFQCLCPTTKDFYSLTEFLKSFCDSSWFDLHVEREKAESEPAKHDADYGYEPGDLNITRPLYNCTLKLFAASQDKELVFQQDVVSVGKESDCDIRLDSAYVSRHHAKFYFENSGWYIADVGSKNGVWLNGKKLTPKTKYYLFSDDEIDIAHEELFVFYKVPKGTESLTETQQAEYIDRAISDWKKEEDNDKQAVLLQLIVDLLLHCPMFIPVSMDMEAMLQAIDIEHLEIGKVQTLKNDVKMKISTLYTGEEELIPIFTTRDELEKGPATSVLHMYPRDYWPKLAAMHKNVIINAFGDNYFVIATALIDKVIIPLLSQKQEVSAPEKPETFVPKEGMIIGGKYELIKQVGEGAFTKTFMAVDKTLNKVWAAKICAKRNVSGGIIHAMINEARLLHKLDHPAIPRIADILDENEYLCILESYIAGTTLENIVKTFGAQPQEKVVEWAKQLCDVLGYLHTQTPPLIYRDVKPANIVLQPDGNIVLIDFGIMRTYKPGQLADTMALGTKGYAAPEQFGARQTDARTDIFGLGMTMHHLLTGVDPKVTNGQTLPIRQYNPALSRRLEHIVKKCIALDPEHRYPSMQKLYSALAAMH